MGLSLEKAGAPLTGFDTETRHRLALMAVHLDNSLTSMFWSIARPWAAFAAEAAV